MVSNPDWMEVFGFYQDPHQLPAPNGNERASCPLSTLLKPGFHFEVPNFTRLCVFAVEIEGYHRGYRPKANSLWAFLVSKKLLIRVAHISLPPTCHMLLFKWLGVDYLEDPKGCWLCSQRREVATPLDANNKLLLSGVLRNWLNINYFSFKC